MRFRQAIRQLGVLSILGSGLVCGNLFAISVPLPNMPKLELNATIKADHYKLSQTIDKAPLTTRQKEQLKKALKERSPQSLMLQTSLTALLQNSNLSSATIQAGLINLLNQIKNNKFTIQNDANFKSSQYDNYAKNISQFSGYISAATQITQNMKGISNRGNVLKALMTSYPDNLALANTLVTFNHQVATNSKLSPQVKAIIMQQFNLTLDQNIKNGIVNSTSKISTLSSHLFNYAATIQYGLQLTNELILDKKDKDILKNILLSKYPNGIYLANALYNAVDYINNLKLKGATKPLQTISAFVFEDQLRQMINTKQTSNADFYNLTRNFYTNSTPLYFAVYNLQGNQKNVTNYPLIQKALLSPNNYPQNVMLAKLLTYTQTHVFDDKKLSQSLKNTILEQLTSQIVSQINPKTGKIKSISSLQQKFQTANLVPIILPQAVMDLAKSPGFGSNSSILASLFVYYPANVAIASRIIEATNTILDNKAYPKELRYDIVNGFYSSIRPLFKTPGNPKDAVENLLPGMIDQLERAQYVAYSTNKAINTIKKYGSEIKDSNTIIKALLTNYPNSQYMANMINSIDNLKLVAPDTAFTAKSPYTAQQRKSIIVNQLTTLTNYINKGKITYVNNEWTDPDNWPNGVILASGALNYIQMLQNPHDQDHKQFLIYTAQHQRLVAKYLVWLKDNGLFYNTGISTFGDLVSKIYWQKIKIGTKEYTAGQILAYPMYLAFPPAKPTTLQEVGDVFSDVWESIGNSIIAPFKANDGSIWNRLYGIVSDAALLAPMFDPGMAAADVAEAGATAVDAADAAEAATTIERITAMSADIRNMSRVGSAVGAAGRDIGEGVTDASQDVSTHSNSDGLDVTSDVDNTSSILNEPDADTLVDQVNPSITTRFINTSKNPLLNSSSSIVRGIGRTYDAAGTLGARSMDATESFTGRVGGVISRGVSQPIRDAWASIFSRSDSAPSRSVSFNDTPEIFEHELAAQQLDAVVDDIDDETQGFRYIVSGNKDSVKTWKKAYSYIHTVKAYYNELNKLAMYGKPSQKMDELVYKFDGPRGILSQISTLNDIVKEHEQDLADDTQALENFKEALKDSGYNDINDLNRESINELLTNLKINQAIYDSGIDNYRSFNSLYDEYSSILRKKNSKLYLNGSAEQQISFYSRLIKASSELNEAIEKISSKLTTLDHNSPEYQIYKSAQKSLEEMRDTLAIIPLKRFYPSIINNLRLGDNLSRSDLDTLTQLNTEQTQLIKKETDLASSKLKPFLKVISESKNGTKLTEINNKVEAILSKIQKLKSQKFYDEYRMVATEIKNLKSKMKTDLWETEKQSVRNMRMETTKRIDLLEVELKQLHYSKKFSKTVASIKKLEEEVASYDDNYSELNFIVNGRKYNGLKLMEAIRSFQDSINGFRSTSQNLQHDLSYITTRSQQLSISDSIYYSKEGKKYLTLLNDLAHNKALSNDEVSEFENLSESLTSNIDSSIADSEKALEALKDRISSMDNGNALQEKIDRLQSTENEIRELKETSRFKLYSRLLDESQAYKNTIASPDVNQKELYYAIKNLRIIENKLSTLIKDKSLRIILSKINELKRSSNLTLSMLSSAEQGVYAQYNDIGQSIYDYQIVDDELKSNLHNLNSASTKSHRVSEIADQNSLPYYDLLTNTTVNLNISMRMNALPIMSIIQKANSISSQHKHDILKLKKIDEMRTVSFTTKQKNNIKIQQIRDEQQKLETYLSNLHVFMRMKTSQKLNVISTKYNNQLGELSPTAYSYMIKSYAGLDLASISKQVSSFENKTPSKSKINSTLNRVNDVITAGSSLIAWQTQILTAKANAADSILKKYKLKFNNTNINKLITQLVSQYKSSHVKPSNNTFDGLTAELKNSDKEAKLINNAYVLHDYLHQINKLNILDKNTLVFRSIAKQISPLSKGKASEASRTQLNNLLSHYSSEDNLNNISDMQSLFNVPDKSKAKTLELHIRSQDSTLPTAEERP